MRFLAGAAAVPAAPLMIPAASPQQPHPVAAEVADLRQCADKALRDLPDVDLVVVVAAGPRGIHDRAHASLAPLGVPEAEIELPVADEAIAHLSRLTQYPVFRGDPLDIDHSVLCLQIASVHPEMHVLPVSVPNKTEFEVLVSVGASIGEAVRDSDLRAVVVCAADLSAGLNETSPRYHIDGAKAWDHEVVEAARDGDLAPLRDLGPEEAQRVDARGWAPLAVLHGVCAAGHLRLEFLRYAAPRGVGQLVARCAPVTDVDERYDVHDERADRHAGIVPRTGDPRG